MKNKKILWAPWRIKYVTESDNMKCIFCEKQNSNEDEKNYILHRGKKVFAMLNIYPYNNGHIMIAPYRHTGEISELLDEELSEMMDMVKVFVDKIKKEMNAHGFNIGMNIGKIAGAGFDEHIHIHIVPRWAGDTNFMPVIGEQKVIPESLESVYRRLRIGSGNNVY